MAVKTKPVCKLDGKNRLQLNQDNWDTLVQVNRVINRNVKYKTDQDLYKRADFWTIANGVGDCEDFALAKRKELLALGYPKKCLKLATCFVEGPRGPGTGEYHAVLMIETDKGSYVLDNRMVKVLHFKDLPYKWHQIESVGGFWQLVAPAAPQKSIGTEYN